MTDVKGRLEYTGNHLAQDPVVGYFDNIAENPSCSDDLWVHVFGSNQEPESPGWLESQKHISTEKFTVPEGATNFQRVFDVPETDYKWCQLEVTRTGEIKVPPYYSGDEMVDYVFVPCGKPVVTPTPTETPTPTQTATTTPTETVVPPSPTATGTPKPPEQPQQPTATPTEQPPSQPPAETPPPATATPSPSPSPTPSPEMPPAVSTEVPTPPPSLPRAGGPDAKGLGLIFGALSTAAGLLMRRFNR